MRLALGIIYDTRRCYISFKYFVTFIIQYEISIIIRIFLRFTVNNKFDQGKIGPKFLESISSNIKMILNPIILIWKLGPTIKNFKTYDSFFPPISKSWNYLGGIVHHSTMSNRYVSLFNCRAAEIETHIQYPRKLCTSDSMSSRCLVKSIKGKRLSAALSNSAQTPRLTLSSLSFSLFVFSVQRVTAERRERRARARAFGAGTAASHGYS